MIIIALALATLARTITRYEIDSIVKKLQAKDAEHDETLSVIRAGMTEEQWQRATQTLNSLKHNSTP
jgi:hypothetical protein